METRQEPISQPVETAECQPAVLPTVIVSFSTGSPSFLPLPNNGAVIPRASSSDDRENPPGASSTQARLSDGLTSSKLGVVDRRRRLARRESLDIQTRLFVPDPIKLSDRGAGGVVNTSHARPKNSNGVS
ncbi:hypothetical protein KM043_005756 [Ampulex compressa]|nr:hypothetical protein KM043_005756 [Ampulex compressa]